jgi:hypothetical protein
LSSKIFEINEALFSFIVQNISFVCFVIAIPEAYGRDIVYYINYINKNLISK